MIVFSLTMTNMRLETLKYIYYIFKNSCPILIVYLTLNSIVQYIIYVLEVMANFNSILAITLDKTSWTYSMKIQISIKTQVKVSERWKDDDYIESSPELSILLPTLRVE